MLDANMIQVITYNHNQKIPLIITYNKIVMLGYTGTFDQFKRDYYYTMGGFKNE